MQTLLAIRSVVDDAGMDSPMMVALILIGGGAVIAGVAGIAMPPGERIAAGLALVIGAGVGVIALAVGVHSLGTSDLATDYERVFLIASCIGFLGVLVSSVLLWLRTRS